MSDSTAKVHYSYVLSGHASLLDSLTYPDGDVLHYGHSTGTSQVSQISDSSGTLETYGYLGLDPIVSRQRPQINLSLSTELDELGRVVDQHWQRGAATVDRFAYVYDASGRVLKRHNTAAAGNLLREDFGYDPLGRLKSFNRGQLPAGSTSDQVNIGYAHQTDTTPQWTEYHDSSHPSAVQEDGVLHDGTQVLHIDGQAPYRRTLQTYNGWGRLSELDLEYAVYEGGQVRWIPGGQSSYSYDALGRLIAVNSGSGANALYYDGDHVIQYGTDRLVHAPDGALILQRSGSALTWVTRDAQGSTASLLDNSGTVLRRFHYDPYGQVQQRQADFSPGGSDVSFPILHSGQLYDAGTRTYHGSSGALGKGMRSEAGEAGKRRPP